MASEAKSNDEIREAGPQRTGSGCRSVATTMAARMTFNGLRYMA